MNFDFSEEQNLLREQARRFLDKKAVGVARHILESDEAFSQDLWDGMAALGWPGAVIPEEYGGTGLTHEDLCIISEEIGGHLAPTPFSSSVYMATEAILLAGTEDQKSHYLPKLASGEFIGTAMLKNPTGSVGVSVTLSDFRSNSGLLTGELLPVPDGDIADFIVVLAWTTGGEPVLTIASLESVSREVIDTIDPTRSHAKLTFNETPAVQLGHLGDGWSLAEQLLDRAAILIAFEQLGGAQRCLEMATDYAKNRFAFGRPIGSFQAIKHKLADVYIAMELARSHAYYGAWALTKNSSDLPIAAAAARVAASHAFNFASSENIQTHGGAGFTWEVDCHLYYRRAKLLSLAIGGERSWKDILVSRLETRNGTA